jgi:hypothetical protein
MARSTSRAVLHRLVLAGSALAAVLALAPVSAAPAATEAQSAQWVQKDLSFVYQGFTTHYSCEGLREQVSSILRQLGARADMKVMEMGCTSGFDRPEPFPGVRAKFFVLVPTDGAGAAASPPTPVAAHWQPLQLKVGNSPLEAAGQCELLEQVKQHILPLFSTRNVDFKSTCVPHELTVGGTSLQAQVLKPDPAPGAPPPAG